LDLNAAFHEMIQSRNKIVRFFSWKPKVLYVSGEPTTRAGHVYRVLRYVDALRAAGFKCDWVELAQLKRSSSKEKLSNIDVLVIWRARWSEELGNLISTARAHDTRIVFDIDDYVFDPQFATIEIRDGIRSQGLREEGVAEQSKSIQKTMKAADYYTCTTKLLASAMERMGKPTFVLPNGFDEQTVEVSRRAVEPGSRLSDGLVRIGYACGSKTHQRDFAVAAPAIARLLRENERCRLVVFERTLELSEFPELLGLESRIENRILVPLKDLPHELARFDINVAPLEVGNPFCEAKSDLKYFEAALVRVPTVASSTEPYRAAIEHGENGFLASSQEDWYACLKALAENPELRGRLGHKAYHHALWQYGPNRRVELVTSVFEQILRGHRPDVFAPVLRLVAKPFTALIWTIGLRTGPVKPVRLLLPRKKRKRLKNIWLIRHSALFDADWYLAQNPDAGKTRLDPILHYLRHGAAKGRDPGPLFDTDSYLKQNPEVAKAGHNPLLHYLHHGAIKRRRPEPGRCNDVNPEVPLL
jgi:glycosyltransferase involved in cell wall biosynthesis